MPRVGLHSRFQQSATTALAEVFASQPGRSSQPAAQRDTAGLAAEASARRMWAPDDYVEADLLGVTEDGAIRAGADPAAYAALQIPNDPERSGPRFEGTLTEFQASHGGTEFAKEFAKNLASTGKTPTARESDFERQALDAQLHNLVRKCAACGKACGFTTTHCNGCNAELPQETVRTDNIFMSFVYGIAKVRCVRPCPHQTSPA